VPAAPPRRLVTQPVRQLDLVAARPATAADDDHGVSPDSPHDDQGFPACCRGPSVEPGAQGGDGTGDGRTDEPVSGFVQFRTVGDVGATGFEPATSTSRKCRSTQAETQPRFVNSSTNRILEPVSFLFA